MKRLIGALVPLLIVVVGISVLYSADQDLPRLEEKFAHLRWVTYAPTNFNPEIGRWPSEESMRADLQLLYDFGFHGVVTYAADGTLWHIPRIAREIGFTGVVVGIWDIDSEEEFDNALVVVDYVDGYCVGSEGLDVRYSLEELEAAISKYQEATGLPVSTTEQIEDYDSSLLSVGDWLFPNVHPYWHDVKEPIAAAEWTVEQFTELTDSADGKYIIFKEVGLPTAGDSECNENNQRTYYRILQGTKIRFAHFEAFDQYWKDNLPVEPYWGIFDKDRNPKLLGSAPQIIYTSVPDYGNGSQDAYGQVFNIDNPDDYRITAYIYYKYGSKEWWVKPYYASRLTSIRSDYTFRVDITTGGNDSIGPYTAVFLVDPTYDPPSNKPPFALLEDDDSLVVAADYMARPRDDDPPEVAIVEPTDQAEIKGNITVVIEADDLSRIRYVYLRFNGGDWLSCHKQGDRWEYDWDTSEWIGQHVELQAQATDYSYDSNVEESEPINVYVDYDSDPPVVQFLNPEDSDEVSGDIEIQVSAEDDSGIASSEVAINQGEWQNLDHQDNYWSMNWSTSNYSDEEGIELQARATDQSDEGNVGYSDVIGVTIYDITEPVVTIIDPEDGDEVSGTITWRAEADDVSGIALVEASINEGVWDDCQPVDGYHEYSFDTTNCADRQEIECWMRATDASRAGNIGYADDLVSVTVRDITVPEVVIVSPSDGDEISGTITIQISADDPSGIYSAAVSIDEGDWRNAYYSDGYRCYSLDTTGYSDEAIVNLRARALDSSRDKNTGYDEVEVTVKDITPPAVKIIAPTGYGYNSGIVTIQIEATDVSSIASVAVSMDSDDWLACSLQGSYWEYSWNTRGYADKTKVVLQARAVDDSRAGNSKDSQTVEVTIQDVTAPELTITEPEDGAVFHDPAIRIIGTSADLSGIASVKVNGFSATGLADWYKDITLIEGSNTITVVAIDKSSKANQTTKEITVTYRDVTPPEVEITEPADEDEVSGTVTVKITATDLSGIDRDSVALRINEDDWQSCQYSYSGYWYYYLDTTVYPDQAELTLQAKAKDKSRYSNEGYDQKNIGAKDITAPDLQIVAPRSGATFDHARVTVTGTAKDASGIQSVKVNNQIAEQDGDNWFTELTLVTGNNDIAVVATDNSANHHQTIREIKVYYRDVNPPQVNIVYPIDGQVVSGLVTIRVQTEDESEIKSVYVRFDNNYWRNCQKVVDGWLYQWDTTGCLDQSLVQIQSKASDASDNINYSETIEVVVRKLPLTISLAINQSSYSLGDYMSVEGTLVNTGEEQVVDIYLGVGFPDGTFVSWPDLVSGLVPAFASFTVPVEFSFGPETIFEIEVPPIPIGDYFWFAALVEPGSLFDVIGDISFAHWRFE